MPRKTDRGTEAMRCDLPGFNEAAARCRGKHALLALAQPLVQAVLQ